MAEREGGMRRRDEKNPWALVEIQYLFWPSPASLMFSALSEEAGGLMSTDGPSAGSPPYPRV